MLKFATMCCDYLLASEVLAAMAKAYRVIRNATTDSASDHYPVLATFEVPRWAARTNPLS
jgi:endonuclease/exonuclease/phosphatase family metal-dependent hydrolase